MIPCKRQQQHSSSWSLNRKRLFFFSDEEKTNKNTHVKVSVFVFMFFSLYMLSLHCLEKMGIIFMLHFFGEDNIHNSQYEWVLKVMLQFKSSTYFSINPLNSIHIWGQHYSSLMFGPLVLNDLNFKSMTFHTFFFSAFFPIFSF